MTSATASVWRDLVTAMLAVYSYTLEKVDGFAEDLEAQGLFEPQQLASLTHEQLFEKLVAAGYKRGDLNGIFVDRLLSLGEAISLQGIAKMETVLRSQDPGAIADMLQPIKGIGPKVIENFLRLRKLKD